MDYKYYYATLDVPRNASQADIKKAFRKLARQYHPDVNKGDAAAEGRFKEINEAHDVLSDPEKRKAYDELGANWEAYQRAGAAGGAGTPFGGARGFAGGPGNIRFEFRGDPEDLAGYSDFFRTFFAGGFGGGAGGTADRPRAGGGSARRSRQTPGGTGSFDLNELFGILGASDVDRMGARHLGAQE